MKRINRFIIFLFVIIVSSGIFTVNSVQYTDVDSDNEVLGEAQVLNLSESATETTFETVEYLAEDTYGGNGDATLYSVWRKCGDIDGDNKITVSDVQLFITGLARGTIIEEAADVNVDGEINFQDLNLLMKLVDWSEPYTVVLESYTSSAASMVSGKLEDADYLTVYSDGEIKDVKVKKITADSPEYNDIATPITFDGENYDFSAYAGKLSKARIDTNGKYYFKLVDFTVSNDFEALADKYVPSNEYRRTGVSAIFYQAEDISYVLNEVNGDGSWLDEVHAPANDIRVVYVRNYTQIIIKSLDRNGETVVALYDINNLPDIKKGTVFKNVSYILSNNVNGIKSENLVAFYGEYDGGLLGDPGKVADVRIIKSSLESSDEDNPVCLYDVFNPATGNIELSIKGVKHNNELPFAKFDIVGFTTKGYIDDTIEKPAGTVIMDNGGDIYDVDSHTYLEDTTGLGWSEVVEFDETTGYLEVNNSGDKILRVTDDTVVSFLDLSAESYEEVDASILASTAKTYRFESNKENPLRVFLCVQESGDATGENSDYFYNIKFAVIVRD